MGPCCSKPPFKQLCRSFQAEDRKFSPSRAAGHKRCPTLLSLGHHGERIPSRQGVTGKVLMCGWANPSRLEKLLVSLQRQQVLFDVTCSFTKGYCKIFPKNLTRLSKASCVWLELLLALPGSSIALPFLQGLRSEMFGKCLCSPTNKLSLSLISHTSISARLSPAGAANAAL